MKTTFCLAALFLSFFAATASAQEKIRSCSLRVMIRDTDAKSMQKKIDEIQADLKSLGSPYLTEKDKGIYKRFFVYPGETLSEEDKAEIGELKKVKGLIFNHSEAGKFHPNSPEVFEFHTPEQSLYFQAKSRPEMEKLLKLQAKYDRYFMKNNPQERFWIEWISLPGHVQSDEELEAQKDSDCPPQKAATGAKESENSAGGEKSAE